MILADINDVLQLAINSNMYTRRNNETIAHRVRYILEYLKTEEEQVIEERRTLIAKYFQAQYDKQTT